MTRLGQQLFLQDQGHDCESDNEKHQVQTQLTNRSMPSRQVAKQGALITRRRKKSQFSHNRDNYTVFLVHGMRYNRTSSINPTRRQNIVNFIRVFLKAMHVFDNTIFKFSLDFVDSKYIEPCNNSKNLQHYAIYKWVKMYLYIDFNQGDYK